MRETSQLLKQAHLLPPVFLHLGNRQKAQMARRDTDTALGSESDKVYVRPRHPRHRPCLKYRKFGGRKNQYNENNIIRATH